MEKNYTSNHLYLNILYLKVKNSITLIKSMINRKANIM